MELLFYNLRRFAVRIFFGLAAIAVAPGIYGGWINGDTAFAGWTVAIGIGLAGFCVLVFFWSSPRWLTLSAVTGIVIGAVPAAYFIGCTLLSERLLKSHLPEYVSIATNADQTTIPSGLPLKGRIVTVDMKEKSIHFTCFGLPYNLRPTTPEQIGAIAALWFSEVKVGDYVGGRYRSPAIRIDCQVEVWEKSTGELLARTTLRGADPPERRQAGNSGPHPYEKIEEYLGVLPHE